MFWRYSEIKGWMQGVFDIMFSSQNVEIVGKKRWFKTLVFREAFAKRVENDRHRHS